MWYSFITVLHCFICIVLVLIVLLQQGRGADMGATFGGGSNTLFGASGADLLLTKVTTGTAIAFMLTSLTLAILTNRGVDAGAGRLFQGAPGKPAAEAAPAATSTAPTAETPSAAAIPQQSEEDFFKE